MDLMDEMERYKEINSLYRFFFFFCKVIRAYDLLTENKEIQQLTDTTSLTLKIYTAREGGGGV